MKNNPKTKAEYYTQEDIKEASYAESRFITVIPEDRRELRSQEVLAVYPGIILLRKTLCGSDSPVSETIVLFNIS